MGLLIAKFSPYSKLFGLNLEALKLIEWDKIDKREVSREHIPVVFYTD